MIVILENALFSDAVYGVHIFLACLVGFLSFVASLTMCKVLCFENVESRQQGNQLFSSLDDSTLNIIL